MVCKYYGHEIPILSLSQICIATVEGVSFAVYKRGAKLIDFWLKPVVVALGVPLYLQLDAIKRLWLPIVLSQFVGCLVGIVSVVLLSYLTSHVILLLHSRLTNELG